MARRPVSMADKLDRFKKDVISYDSCEYDYNFDDVEERKLNFYSFESIDILNSVIEDLSHQKIKSTYNENFFEAKLSVSAYIKKEKLGKIATSETSLKDIKASLAIIKK